MKLSALLAVLLSSSLPNSAFAQSYAAARAGVASESAASGAIGTFRIAPTDLSGIPLTPAAPSVGSDLTPAPAPAPAPAPVPVPVPALAPTANPVAVFHPGVGAPVAAMAQTPNERTAAAPPTDRAPPSERRRALAKARAEVAAPDSPFAGVQFPASEKVEAVSGQDQTGKPEAGFPSPKNWEALTGHSIMTDRAYRSGEHWTLGDQTDGNSTFGGNFRGLAEGLKDLAKAGVKVVHFTPPMKNIPLPRAHHGYEVLNFLEMNPLQGTLAEAQAAVKIGHDLGMRFIGDMVITHAGEWARYKNGENKWQGKDKVGREFEKLDELGPANLGVSDFVRGGHIVDYNGVDRDQLVMADPFHTLLKTNLDNPETLEKMTSYVLGWIKALDLDGIRLDLAKHIRFDPSLPTDPLRTFVKRVQEFAASMGKNNFMIVMEVIHHDWSVLKPYLDIPGVSLYHYPDFLYANEALHGRKPTAMLEDSARKTSDIFGANANNLVLYSEGHDAPRFLSDQSSESLNLFGVSQAYKTFSQGRLPMNYYGSEWSQYQNHPSDFSFPAPWNREVMFEGTPFSWSKKISRHDYLRKLADTRAAYPALQLGNWKPRWSNPNGPGIYSFSRVHEGKDVLVILNTSRDPQDMPGNTGGHFIVDHPEVIPSFNTAASIPLLRRLPHQLSCVGL